MTQLTYVILLGSKKNMSKTSSFHLIKRLCKDHIFPYYGNVTFACICMIIASCAEGAQAYLVQPMLDKIFVGHNPNMVNILTFAVIAVTITKAISNYFQSVLMKSIGQKILTDLQAKLYDHLIRLDISFLQNQSSGRLISRFTSDIGMLRNTITNGITGIIQQMITTIFLVGIMFYQNPKLSAIAIGIFPLGVLPLLKLSKKMRKIAKSTQEEIGNYVVGLDDSFQNIKIIKSFCVEDHESMKVRLGLDKLYNLYYKAARAESLGSPMMEMIGGISIALVVWYGGSQVISGETTPGSFFSFITALIMAYKPVKGLAALNSVIQEGLASSARIFAIFDIKPLIIPGDKIIGKMRGDIELNNISFSYPQSNYESLKNVSFKINAGETVAFVGESGSGKSTIVNLLLRFYDPVNGKILIDETNISELKFENLRRNISYVAQDSMLFDTNFEENIKYGLKNASNAQIEKIAQLTALNFIEDYPEKYQTEIGQHGIKLSGGQRQRLAIARALIKNASILILDEASSALDNITERRIFENIKELRTGKTTIIIAHRLSTIVDADKIYVFDKGQLIEIGTHQELIQKGGKYNELYQKDTK